MRDDELLTLRPLGIFLLGEQVNHFNAGLSVLRHPPQIAQLLEPFRPYSRVTLLQDIGLEAIALQDALERQADSLTDLEISSLKDMATKWHTQIGERLGSLYLITPATVIDPKRLMGDIEGLLNPEAVTLLEPMEAIVLEEAMHCILIDSPTASEVMSIRTAESLTGRWYEQESGKRVGRKTLGGLLKWFREEYKPRQGAQLELTLLDYLNQRRNILAHPRVLSELGHAQTTLLNVCTLVRGVGRFLNVRPASQPETDSNEA